MASSSRASASRSFTPWRHLGALGFYLFWIVAASGIYVYAFFDTSVAGAHASLERLAREQWWLGGVMRSLHRYASDAFVLVALAHLVREALAGHFRGYRWFSWASGVLLLWFVYGSGVIGYWLVWDGLAQLSATATAEWFDALGLGAGLMVRNFLTRADVTDRLFSLLVFLHIGIPLALLAAMWVHIQRIAHTDTVPPRALGWSVLALLLAVSLARPAASGAPAAFGALPPALSLDWFYLFAHPLMYDAVSPQGLWWLLGGLTVALMALPLAFPRKPKPAVVHLARCTGCGQCAHDCPYLAISMVPRTDGRAFLKQAAVRAEQCAACGICAGSCPTAAPLEDARTEPGIDLPVLPLAAILREMKAGETIVVRCRHAADASSENARAVLLECAGQLPPSFAQWALRQGARAVQVRSCAQDACEYRLGARWLHERMTGAREPHLHPAAQGKVGIAPGGERPSRPLLHAGLLSACAVLIAWFSTMPAYRPLAAGEALVRVIVMHAGEPLRPCRKLSAEELARRAPNMRAPEECPRGRAAVPVRVELGGQVLVDELLVPGGTAKDGAAQLYRRAIVRAGRQELRVRVADSARPGARAWEREATIDLAPGAVLTVDFNPERGGIFLP